MRAQMKRNQERLEANNKFEVLQEKMWTSQKEIKSKAAGWIPKRPREELTMRS
jgi:hypothetical protein